MDKLDIIEYGYYDESGEYIVVLNTDKLKKIFNANKIKLSPENN